MKYFIFTLLFALQVLGQNTRVLPRGISIPAGSVLVGNSTGVGTTTPVGISGQFLQSAGTSTPVWKNIQGGGEVNFITNGDGQDGTTGFVTGSYSAAAKPAGTFTASSGSSAFEVANTFAPLGTGTTSLTFTKYAGASRQGRAVEYEFNLPVAYRAKVLTIKNQYIINSGTFVAGTNSTNSSMIFYTAFYDGSSWSVAEPSSFTLLSNSSTVSDVFSATVQSPSNATKMKLIAYVAETATTAWEVKANISVSPSTYVFGTPITDWASYTPTGSWSTNTTYTGLWRRVGKNLEFRIRVALAGAPSAGSITINYLPSGLAIDTSSLLASVTDGTVPIATGVTKSAGTLFDVSAYYNGTNIAPVTKNASATYTGASSNIAPTIPATYTSGDSIEIYGAVPILGWSSSVQMSDQADTRVVAAKAFGGAPSTTLNTPIIPTTASFDTLSSIYSAGRFTAPIPGYYKIFGTLRPTSASAFTVYLWKNGVQGEELIGFPASEVSGRAFATEIFLNAGEIVDIRPNVTTTYSNSTINFVRISGPSAIAASESINLSYGSTAGGSIGTSDTLQTFGSKEIDSHGAWSGTVFTAPISGVYSVNATILTQGVTLSTTQSIAISVYKNGSYYRVIGYARGNGATTIAYFVTGADLIYLKAGETLSIYSGSSVATAQTTSGGYNKIQITRVGN